MREDKTSDATPDRSADLVALRRMVAHIEDLWRTPTGASPEAAKRFERPKSNAPVRPVGAWIRRLLGRGG